MTMHSSALNHYFGTVTLSAACGSKIRRSEMTTQAGPGSPWGEDDQIGAMNFVTSEKLVPLFQGVKKGRIYDLGQVIQVGAPRIEPFMPPYVMGMWTNAEKTRQLLRENMKAVNEAGVLLEWAQMTFHVGTHIDALGHFTIGDEMYNGNSAQEAIGNWGLERLGIEQAPPIITRGVILDLASYNGVEHLDGGTVVTPSDLEGVARQQGVSIQPGDAVLLHTGWSKYFMADNQKYVSTAPGLGEEGARWLTEQNIAAIGADNMTVEVVPMEDQRKVFPVHQHFLVEKGVYMIENLRLHDALKDGVYEFLFILLPVKYKGATASPVQPVAVV
jgi:kynurenine formamidase